jgi:hypothetical protein
MREAQGAVQRRQRNGTCRRWMERYWGRNDDAVGRSSERATGRVVAPRFRRSLIPSIHHVASMSEEDDGLASFGHALFLEI